MNLRMQVIKSIFKRNLASYFSGVLGYLFIVVFVAIGGYLAFKYQSKFFTANEPNLDQLSDWFPLLLLFFIPAITMNVWAEEKKMGTDELLFTMPATDLEVLIGKYLSVVGVYTIALGFSLCHVLVLVWLGNPDWGLIAATYFGYWIAGAAMVSAGMVASILTANMPVAFVLGILICGIPVFIGQAGSMIGLGDALNGFSLNEQFRDFGMGVIPLLGLFYFVSFTVLMLYLNHVLMTYRHWAGQAMGVQYLIRTACIGVILCCVTAWAGYTTMRVDATSERLFSLSPVTTSILGELKSDRPIEIQAFLSPEVPREYVETRKRLVGLLRQYDRIGGNGLEVRFVDVEPFSDQADEAEHFGIEPIEVMSERDGRRSMEEVFLGAVIISSYDKVVVPFFGKGLPLEYELTRSIQTVANEKRHTVGILQTDANVISGTGGWQIVTELKKQYNVEEVSPSTDIDAEKFDVLLAAMPSSLTAEAMDNLVAYAKTGSPLLIFDDPFPLTMGGQFGITGAPKQQKSRPHQGMMGMGQTPPPEPKADDGRATRLLTAIGVDWEYDRCVFDVNNPHPEFASLPAEYVFVTDTEDEKKAFNQDSEITQGLQEIIALYPGEVKRRSGAEVDFTPLLNTGSNSSGVMKWEEFVNDGGLNFFSMQATVNPRRNPLRRNDMDTHALAAHVKGELAGNKVNAIFVSDVDMISDFFFQERNLGNLSMKFDNVTFVLNAVDSLVGDASNIELRSRRPGHRTLRRMEAKTREFLEDANAAERAADDAADKELDERREQLSKIVKEIQDNEDLDPIAKSQMLQQAQQTEQQRMSLAEAQIEKKKDDEIQRIRARTKNSIRAEESRIGALATWLPPIPPLIVGLIVFVRRWQDEKNTVTEVRRRGRS